MSNSHYKRALIEVFKKLIHLEEDHGAAPFSVPSGYRNYELSEKAIEQIDAILATEVGPDGAFSNAIELYEHYQQRSDQLKSKAIFGDGYLYELQYLDRRAYNTINEFTKRT